MSCWYKRIANPQLPSHHFHVMRQSARTLPSAHGDSKAWYCRSAKSCRSASTRLAVCCWTPGHTGTSASRCLTARRRPGCRLRALRSFWRPARAPPPAAAAAAGSSPPYGNNSKRMQMLMGACSLHMHVAPQPQTGHASQNQACDGILYIVRSCS